MDARASFNDIVQITTEIESTIPLNFSHDTATISISPAVNVKFPTYESSLSKLHHKAESRLPGWHEVTARYWQTCQEFQDAFTRRYLEILKSLRPIAELGGPSDLSLQTQVATGLSHLYEQWEARLANSVIQRYKNVVPTTGKTIHSGKVRISLSPPSCLADLLFSKGTRQTFSAVPSPPAPTRPTPNETTWPNRPA